MARTQRIQVPVSPEEYEQLAARAYEDRPPKRLHGRLNLASWIREQLGLRVVDDGAHSDDQA